MCSDDDHNSSQSPSNICSWCSYICSYILPLIAVGLILMNVLPYYFLFFPKLYAACLTGQASWFYYFYCHIIIAIAEFLVFINFYFAITTSPGFVEREPWARIPVFKGKIYSDNMNEVFQLGRDGKLRFCFRCELFKPDNAHHCRSCRRCVYYMDHHCPWINNCVGRDNAKYFILFVSYIPLGAFHIAFTVIYSLSYHFSFRNSSEMIASTGLLVLFILSFSMGIAFFAFAAHFIWMAFHGETTVANVILKDKLEKRNAKENKIKYWNDVFGRDRRWWRLMCPVTSVQAVSTGSMSDVV